MKKAAKGWLIIAAALVLAGGGLFAGVMSTLGWDFSKLSTVRYETNTYEIGEAFSDISLTTDTADILFALSDDGKCRVACYEEENAGHFVAVEADALAIRINNQKSWRDYIGFSLASPRITVYLPQAEYQALSISGSTGSVEIPEAFSFKNADISSSTGNVVFRASVAETLKIKTSTGNIRAEKNAAGALDISVTTGNVYLTDMACESVASSGTTGNIALNNVISTGKISIERSTGDVRFDHCDAAEIYVKTNTGSVTGNLLSSKAFAADTHTGRINVPATAEGGKCEIITSTGDIQLTIAQP